MVELLGPGNYSVIEGNELALVCRGSSNLHLGWSKVNGLMVTGEEFIVGEQVIIQKVNRQHTGTYRCQDIHNPQLFIEKTVSVLYGPGVEVMKTYVHSQGSVHLHLICQVESFPPASITWYKDGHLLNSTHQVALQAVLTYSIVHPSTQDFGTYTCQANGSTSVIQSLSIAGFEPESSGTSLVHLHLLLIYFVTLHNS